jgi:hypothetical protein
METTVVLGQKLDFRGRGKAHSGDCMAAHAGTGTMRACKRSLHAFAIQELLNKNCYYTLNNERFRDRQLSKRMEPAFSMIIERALGLSSNGELNHCPFLLP